MTIEHWAKSESMRPLALDEYHIVVCRAGYTVVVRIQSFHVGLDGIERSRVVAERSTDSRSMSIEELVEWIATARHECREALEVGPGLHLDEPKTVVP